MATVRAARFVPLVLGLGFLTGCGGPPGKGDVTGTIKLRGEAPKFYGLQVVFLSEDGSLSSAEVNDDGTYKAEGVPAGEAKVCFAYTTPEAAKMGAEFKAGGRKMSQPGEEKKPTAQPKLTGNEPATNPVPPELCEHTTSKLTVKVEVNKTTAFDYDIKP